MAKLTYTAITSLDGYVTDRDGRWDWSVPDAEVHAFVNDHERPVGTYLLGRRMYDVLVAWETMDVADEPAEMRDYKALWLAADKVVYSRSLEGPRSERTRVERELDPTAVRELKSNATSEISVGGADLAGQALGAGLVDEILLIVSPVVVGGGNSALPSDQRLDLELLEERVFGNGVFSVRYLVR